MSQIVCWVMLVLVLLSAARNLRFAWTAGASDEHTPRGQSNT